MGLQPSVGELVMWFFVSHHREKHMRIKCARNRNGYPAKKKQRQRFSIITKMVSAIMADPTQRAAYEQLQKDTYGARKMTLRKFVFQKVAATLIPVKDTESPQMS